MSVRKSKLDLLVKVRYQNPLPAPPFPPKLLTIETNPSRYANSELTQALANETLLPMVVDGECGMPLDLSQWDSLWGLDPNGDSPSLNPSKDNLPQLDPRDTFLLAEPSTSSVNANGAPSTSSISTSHVSWLRKTEYLSREGVNKVPVAQDIKHLHDKPIDVSRAAQIRDIEASFQAGSENFSLSNLRHPNKPGVQAVESYEVLPDIDIWANAYDLFKFSERPGDRHPDVPDPRLDTAILRPMESDGDHFLAYYLPKEDEVAEQFKAGRQSGEEMEETIFSFVRDYETVKIEQDVPNEFLLVLDDGPADDTKAKRPKGAFYKGIERKIMLKKKRVNQWENISYADKWDAINLTLAPFTTEELEEREEASAEVTDPLYLLSRMDADGEADDTEQDGAVQPAQTNGDTSIQVED